MVTTGGLKMRFSVLRQSRQRHPPARRGEFDLDAEMVSNEHGRIRIDGWLMVGIYPISMNFFITSGIYDR